MGQSHLTLPQVYWSNSRVYHYWATHISYYHRFIGVAVQFTIGLLISHVTAGLFGVAVQFTIGQLPPHVTTCLLGYLYSLPLGHSHLTLPQVYWSSCTVYHYWVIHICFYHRFIGIAVQFTTGPVTYISCYLHGRGVSGWISEWCVETLNQTQDLEKGRTTCSTS